MQFSKKFAPIAKTLILVLIYSLTFDLPRVFAQSIRLVGPLTSQTVNEGDDYASIELGNPWDMNERRDMGWEESFQEASIKSEKGIWTGNYRLAGAYVYPLFPGFAATLLAEPLDGDRSLPRFGQNHPIDPRKYSLLSFKMSASYRSSVAVYWSKTTSKEPINDLSQNGAIFDGYYHAGQAIYQKNDQKVIYSFDMKNLKTSFHMASGAWDGKPISMRIHPSTAGEPGTVVAFDWVRLVDPRSAPQVTISWTGTELPMSKVIRVWEDNNNSGYNGTPLAVFTDYTNPGKYTFPSAMLNPGTHYFYLTVEYGSELQNKIVSNYSAPLVINAKPIISFQSPSPISAADYATAEGGNSWDMSDVRDVQTSNEVTLTNSLEPTTKSLTATRGSFSNGILTALASGPTAGHTESDAHIVLNVAKARPIVPSRYRYLTYRVSLDSRNYGDIHDKVQRGWVARAVYFQNDLFKDGGETRAHVVYENFNTYTIDLWNTSIIENGLRWKDNRYMQTFRFDPTEADVATYFSVDWIKLAAENYSTPQGFNVKWNINDPDNAAVTVELYYDTNNNGYDGKNFATFTNTTIKNGSVVWNTSKLPAGGTYYIYALVKDGKNTYRKYAQVPIKTGSPVQVSGKQHVPYDYDGDNKSDLSVYRPSSNTTWINGTATGGRGAAYAGGKGTALAFDYDGDSRANATLARTTNGLIEWLIEIPETKNIASIFWGLAGDYPVPGDYNGDGISEIAVWRPSNGTWYILLPNNTAQSEQWGLPGDIPVPGDYNGDGITEIAIWRPSTGTWWIKYKPTSTTAPAAITGIQFGLPGDTPIVGDNDNDGKSDLLLYRSTWGLWFTKAMATGATTATAWGLPADAPRVGDFNGDGKLDLSVFRPSSGTWYHNYQNGQTAILNWGLNGDIAVN